jgi:hypothetical protein
MSIMPGRIEHLLRQGAQQGSKHRGVADLLSIAGARITALVCARYTRVCTVTDGLSQRAPAGSDYLSLAAMLVVPFCCKRSYPRSRGNPHPHGWQASRHPFNLVEAHTLSITLLVGSRRRWGSSMPSSARARSTFKASTFKRETVSYFRVDQGEQAPQS